MCTCNHRRWQKRAPVLRTSFPSPFRIRSCTRTKKPPLRSSVPLHTTRRRREGGRPRNRDSSFLHALPPAGVRHASMFPIGGAKRGGREQGRWGETEKGKREEKREPPINSHVYLDLKVGVFRRTADPPTDRPRCRRRRHRRVSRVHALTRTPSIEGGREAG